MVTVEKFTDEIRDAVLEALDEVARRHFKDKGTVLGATDAELPALFRGLDAHAATAHERLSNQLNVPLQRALQELKALNEGRAVWVGPYPRPRS